MLESYKLPNFKVEDVLSSYLNRPKQTQISKYLDRNKDVLKNKENEYKDVYQKVIETESSNDTTLTNDMPCLVLDTEMMKKAWKNKYISNFLHNKFFPKSQIVYCVICGTELINRSIDHVLPKSKYPEYTLTPLNLVPICNDCNFFKGKKEEGVYNSYIENEKEIWQHLLNSYKVEFENGKIKFVENSLDTRFKKILESYGLDKRIKLKGAVIASSIIEQVKFIIEGNKFGYKINITKEYIRNILDGLNYNTRDISALVIAVLKENLSIVLAYLNKEIYRKKKTDKQDKSNQSPKNDNDFEVEKYIDNCKDIKILKKLKSTIDKQISNLNQ